MSILPFDPCSEAPPWFVDNIRQPGTSHTITANNSRIHFLAWNWENSSLPVLILAHGFGGHAHWWSFLAPFFTSHYRVAALDFPGMGDSGFLTEYHEESFARAILAVIDHHQLRDVTIVGHSFGGIHSLRAMLLEPQAFKQGIVVDSFVCLPPMEPPRLIEAKGRHKLRPTHADCMAELRLMPPQPEVIDALLRFISYHSCTGDETGWHWKFDPALRNHGEIRDPQMLSRIVPKIHLIYGELSRFNAHELPARILNHFPHPGTLTIVPGAYHHIMLDHPLELVAAIDAILSQA